MTPQIVSLTPCSNITLTYGRITRIGKIRILEFVAKVAKDTSISNGLDICYVATNDAPRNSIEFLVISQEGSACSIMLGQDGHFYIVPKNKALTTGTWICTTCTYVTK